MVVRSFSCNRKVQGKRCLEEPFTASSRGVQARVSINAVTDFGRVQHAAERDPFPPRATIFALGVGADGAADCRADVAHETGGHARVARTERVLRRVAVKKREQVGGVRLLGRSHWPRPTARRRRQHMKRVRNRRSRKGARAKRDSGDGRRSRRADRRRTKAGNARRWLLLGSGELREGRRRVAPEGKASHNASGGTRGWGLGVGGERRYRRRCGDRRRGARRRWPHDTDMVCGWGRTRCKADERDGSVRRGAEPRRRRSVGRLPNRGKLAGAICGWTVRSFVRVPVRT